MRIYRIEIVLIVFSLGALLFVLGSVAQAVAPGSGTAFPETVTLAASRLPSTQAANAAPLASGPTSTSAARPANCVPLPPAVTLGPGTPSATPAAILHRFDLAPNLGQEQKSSVLVLRCDGSWDQYWLAPAQVFDSQKELKPGDVVFSVSPHADAVVTQAPAVTNPATATRPAASPGSATPTARTATPARTPTPNRTAAPSTYPAPQSQSTTPAYP